MVQIRSLSGRTRILIPMSEVWYLSEIIFSVQLMITNSKGKWICVDWTTGKTMWITDWYNKGAIISADGMLYIIEEKSGHVGLLKPDSQKFDLVSSFQITKGEGPIFLILL